MSERKTNQRKNSAHLSGASLYDLLHLEDEWSDEVDEETSSASSKLERFLSESGNALCADCGSSNPKWVSANIGAVVCIMCSGVHRSLGVHISKILSVNLDEWTDEDVDNFIKLGGNTAINLKYEHSIPDKIRKPHPESSIDERTDFIKRKYVMQQFLNTDDQLSCPFTPSAFHCSSAGLNNVVEKKYINSMRLHGIGQAFINNRRRKDAEQKPAKKSTSTAGMVEFVGFIKVNVVKGSDLAIRDVRSSDPYVMLTLGNQSVKTRVIRNNLNPVWNEKLMLSIPDNVPPLIVNVFDKDKFSTDDHMGEAEIDIQPLVSAAKSLENSNGSEPSAPLERRAEGEDKNTLGMITVAEGKAKQDIAIKLQNVESGELHIEIECVPLSQ